MSRDRSFPMTIVVFIHISSLILDLAYVFGGDAE